jgi:hypothetical protein
MSLIEGYRKNVWTITVTDQTFFMFFPSIWAQNALPLKIWAECALFPTFTGPKALIRATGPTNQSRIWLETLESWTLWFQGRRNVEKRRAIFLDSTGA